MLTTEERVLLRRVVEWRRANGWTFGFYPGRGEADWRCDRWIVEADINDYGVQLIADDTQRRRSACWPASVREGVDVLCALGVLPQRFSSSFAAGRESAYDRDEWRVCAGLTAEFPVVFDDEIGSEEHLAIVLRDARCRWRGKTVWAQHRRTGGTDWERVDDDA